MTRKKHINKFLAPAQSRDNPANVFMFMCFSFPELKLLDPLLGRPHLPGANKVVVVLDLCLRQYLTLLFLWRKTVRQICQHKRVRHNTPKQNFKLEAGSSCNSAMHGACASV